MIKKYVCHSKHVMDMAKSYGWLPAARYTNLRDVRTYDKLSFLDIDWKNYNFYAHLNAVREYKPILTVARDVEEIEMLDSVLEQAEELSQYAEEIMIVPKDPRFADRMEIIPSKYLLGYSVPSRYGATALPVSAFNGYKVHLLGGRPDIQRELAKSMYVVSIDCNRFTLDAAYGDYFDGKRFKPHPVGGYNACLRESLCNINALWNGYKAGSVKWRF